MNLYNEYMKLNEQEKDELARRVFLERCSAHPAIAEKFLDLSRDSMEQALPHMLKAASKELNMFLERAKPLIEAFSVKSANPSTYSVAEVCRFIGKLAVYANGEIRFTYGGRVLHYSRGEAVFENTDTVEKQYYLTKKMMTYIRQHGDEFLHVIDNNVVLLSFIELIDDQEVPAK